MKRVHWLGVSVVSMAMMSVPILAQLPATPDHEHATPATQGKMGRAGMPAMDHQKMMADMVAADARLRELLATMNAATGDQKLGAMADLMTQLVTDLKDAHHHMMEMHNEMMPRK